MFVLARKIGQQIVLPGCGVTIDIVSATKSQVRLGIEAPSDVTIFRRELLDRIRGQGESQAGRKAKLTKKATSLAAAAEVHNTAGVSKQSCVIPGGLEAGLL